LYNGGGTRKDGEAQIHRCGALSMGRIVAANIGILIHKTSITYTGKRPKTAVFIKYRS
jgi:hypothetical protein